eukprot:g728.t1
MSSLTRRNAKKWCTYCKIFIGSNTADANHHEKGWRHKNNVQRYLKKQLVGSKKRASSDGISANKRKIDNGEIQTKGPEVEFIHDAGYYVVDGRPYLEAEYHQELLKSKGVIAQAVYPDTDDWLPVTISHKNRTHLGEGMSEKVLVIFFTRENTELFIPIADVRLAVAPPPPPRDNSKSENINLNDDGFMFSENKDVATGLGMWKTTAIIESEEEDDEIKNEDTNNSDDVGDAGGGALDYVVKGAYRGVKLDDNTNMQNSNVKITAKNTYVAPDSIKAVSTAFKKRKKKRQRKGNTRKSVNTLEK